ncbi:HesA/MoeB/ThiF family protein [Gemmobacter serpentinus]|uniref:HesA/MoeB/ThiF family protein n=1 Tax=Gemmobacter serpentinus TaxID=2652247 RepID=UPI00124D70D4|nr:molybdopterin-synthase adenylyltransferase MoeB [Gemmobacter serpentinus]
MIPVLAAFAAIWFIGRIMAVPARQRLGLIGVLWAAVVLALLLLPEGGLRQALGGDARYWLVLGGLAATVLGYRAALATLRRRSAPPVEATPAPLFREAEVNRYSRHLLMREIGGPGQARLKAARVLVLGAGGLGSPVCLYLAAAGVGRITVVDDDGIDSSNLQRQIIHRDAGIGSPKALSAAAAMRALNPFIEVTPLVTRLEESGAAAALADHDLVLDGSDNFATRYLLNRLAAQAGIPLISGAMTPWEGQVSLFDPARGTACYACVFPEAPPPGTVPACSEAGVAAPLPGIIGSMMAMEAVKHLTGAGQTLAGRLLMHDALNCETRVIKVKPRAGCPVCGGGVTVARA